MTIRWTTKKENGGNVYIAVIGGHEYAVQRDFGLGSTWVLIQNGHRDLGFFDSAKNAKEFLESNRQYLPLA